MICRSSFETGRLNAFQRVMRHWSELHPYNAMHTYKIAGRLRLHDLRDAIAKTYVENGIGIVEVLPDGLTYHYEIDANPEIQVVFAGDAPHISLDEHLNRELNRPFDRPRCRPMRFSAIETNEDAHYVSITYDHWTSDSVAARLVLQRILGRYCHLAIPGNEQPLERYPGTYREVFGHRLGNAQLGAAAVGTLNQWLRHRSAPQVAYGLPSQMANNFELHRTEPGTVAKLREFSRSLGVTVHDVMLAALGRSIAEFLPSRASRRGRDMLLGTIVDTRGDSREDLSDTLGTFLSYYSVRASSNARVNLAESAQRIAGMTHRVKSRSAYLNSLLNMRFVDGIWPHLNEATRPYFMRRALPMAAGVTNVYLRDSWMERYGTGRILEYFRGASTGPSLPLVLSPTTVGQQLNIGVSYRIAGFSSKKIGGIMEMVLDQLQHPESHVGVRGVRGNVREKQRAAA